MRKLRNSARFILGNIGTTERRKDFVRVEQKDLGLVNSFIWLASIPLTRISRPNDT